MGTVWMWAMPLMALITYAAKRGGGFQTRLNIFVFIWESLIICVGQITLVVMFNPTYILSFPFHQEITEGNDIPDSSFADVPTSEGEVRV